MSSISVLVGAPFSPIVPCMYSSRTLYGDVYHCLLMIRCRPGHIDSRTRWVCLRIHVDLGFSPMYVVASRTYKSPILQYVHSLHT